MKSLDISNIQDYKKSIESKSIWDIKLPIDDREWFVLSTCNNLDLDFIHKYDNKLSLENVVVNKNLSCREQLALEYKDKINWTNVALSAAYRINGMKEKPIDDETLLTYKLIKDNLDKVNWDKVCNKRYFCNVNNNFLKEFIDNVDWNKIIINTDNRINKNIVKEANDKGYIDWKKISSNTTFSSDFIKDNHEHINWEEYLKKNSFSAIPIECQNRDNIMIAIRNNPDILNLIADKNLYASASDFLKTKVWIDRIPDDETHFADDSTIREEHLLEHHWVDKISEGKSHFDDEQEYKDEHTWVDNAPTDELHYNDSEEEFEL